MGTSWKVLVRSTLLLVVVLFAAVQSLPVGSEEKSVVREIMVSSIALYINWYMYTHVEKIHGSSYIYTYISSNTILTADVFYQTYQVKISSRNSGWYLSVDNGTVTATSDEDGGESSMHTFSSLYT